MKLALFDLDGTLLPHDSDHAFGEHMIALGWVDERAHREANDHFYRQYQAGCLDVDAYVDFATAPWRARSEAEQQAALASFMRERIEPHLHEVARDLVRAHQRAGDTVAIVTATNEFVTAPIAAALGVDTLIATRLERDHQGRVTGRIAGTPSFREGKIARVDDWLATLGRRWADYPHTVFYSDSPNDLPLLERASEPVATNPSPALEAIALERGWRILRLFP